MRKSTAFGLASIVLGSIAIRLSPLLTYLYWGSDTAEYLVILHGLVQTGHVSTVYYGWGITYPYFPGMFFAQVGLVDLGRPDIPTVLDLLIPTLGALAVLPRSEEHTSELQSQFHLVCRLLLEKKKKKRGVTSGELIQINDG